MFKKVYIHTSIIDHYFNVRSTQMTPSCFGNSAGFRDWVFQKMANMWCTPLAPPM